MITHAHTHGQPENRTPPAVNRQRKRNKDSFETLFHTQSSDRQTWLYLTAFDFDSAVLNVHWIEMQIHHACQRCSKPNTSISNNQIKPA